MRIFQAMNNARNLRTDYENIRLIAFLHKKGTYVLFELFPSWSTFFVQSF